MGACVARQSPMADAAPGVMFCKALHGRSPLPSEPSTSGSTESRPNDGPIEPTTPLPPFVPHRRLHLSTRGSSDGGEFPLATNPVLALRVLSECKLTAEDLARLEATCTFFKKASNFPPDLSLSLAEVAALDMCQQRKSFAAMTELERDALRHRCGGSWKLVLRFLVAGETCCRRGKSQVVAGCAHSVAVGRDGTVWTFGNGNAGQLGHGGTTNEIRPRAISSLAGHRVVQVAAGRSRTMLVTEQGQVYRLGRDCYGDQDHGLNSPKPISTPKLVESLANIWAVQVTMGSFFTAVLSREGQVYTFSWGEKDRIGHATDSADTGPRLLEGPLSELPVAQIAGGHCYLLALAWGPAPLGRSVWSVGCGLGGKLGHGTRSDEREPREITHFQALNFQPVAIAAGAWHSAALSSDGRVATWGWGRHGCLGHGGDHCELQPRVVDMLQMYGPSWACHVAAGDYTTFVVGKNGEVWSFGSAESSCLGHVLENLQAEVPENAEAEERREGQAHCRKDVLWPRRMLALEGLPSGDRVVQISPSNAGHWDAHMLALTEKGRLLSCGSGSKGQLGAELLGGSYERNIPEIVEGLFL